MHRFSFLSGLLLFILTINLAGQQYTLSGYVQDNATGERLIAASVYDSISGKGTSTNEYGFFSLSVPAGEIRLLASYVGYSTFSETIRLGANLNMNIHLEPSLELEEVVVTTNRPRDIVQDVQMSTVHIPVKEIKTIPMFMGEADVIKTIQLMPGVQSGTEGTSGIYVRGGGPDQNLFLLDGVPIYNANHLFGFFSVFNLSLIHISEPTRPY